MTEPRSLEQVLADAAEESAVLRKHRQVAVADAIDSLCLDVRTAAESFLRWLSEPQAQLRSGHRVQWLRARFPRWAEEGMARWNPKASNERQYLQAVIPQRRRETSVADDARREARGVA